MGGKNYRYVYSAAVVRGTRTLWKNLHKPSMANVQQIREKTENMQVHIYAHNPFYPVWILVVVARAVEAMENLHLRDEGEEI